MPHRANTPLNARVRAARTRDGRPGSGGQSDPPTVLPRAGGGSLTNQNRERNVQGAGEEQQIGVSRVAGTGLEALNRAAVHAHPRG